MPSSVGRDLGRKFDRMGSEVHRAVPSAVRAGALALTTAVRAEIQRATGDGRLSGVGRNGARVGARFDQRGPNQAVVKATGPLHLIERDTKPRTIQPKKRRGAKALRLADGSFVASAQHPGTKGKHPFAKGIQKGRPAAERAVRNPVSLALKKGMKA